MNSDVSVGKSRIPAQQEIGQMRARPSSIYWREMGRETVEHVADGKRTAPLGMVHRVLCAEGMERAVVTKDYEGWLLRGYERTITAYCTFVTLTRGPSGIRY